MHKLRVVLISALLMLGVGFGASSAVAQTSGQTGTHCYSDGLCYDYVWECNAQGCTLRVTRIFRQYTKPY